MNKENIDIIKKTLGILKGKKLQTFMRSGSVGDLGFGEYIEKNIRGFNDEKQLVKKIVHVPQYVFQIDCHFRLSCGNEIILSRGDIFQPFTTMNAEYDCEEFDWDVKGNNRFDHIVDTFFQKQDSDFIVSKISVNQLGDIKIHFENGFLLDISPDVSGREECWRFFEQQAEEHLIVNGQGVEREDE